MPTPNQLSEDLRYVRDAVDRQREGVMPFTIALLWSAYVLIGFTALDLRPAIGGLFLTVAGPLAYLISLRMGQRSAQSSGIRDSTTGRLHRLHWGSLFLAGAALLLVATENGISGQVLGQVSLILSGLVYLLAGIHFRIGTLVGVGIAMMCAAVVLTYIGDWGWTGVGIVLAAGILATGRRRVPNV